MRYREHDATGRLVPWHLRKAFEGRRHLLRWAQKVERLRNELAHIGNLPYCRCVEIVRVVRALEAARLLVIRGAPFGQCDCTGQEYGCQRCGGQRWLTVDQMPYPKIKEPS